MPEIFVRGMSKVFLVFLEVPLFSFLMVNEIRRPRALDSLERSPVNVDSKRYT